MIQVLDVLSPLAWTQAAWGVSCRVTGAQKSNLLNVTSEIWDNGWDLTIDLVKQAFVHISFLRCSGDLLCNNSGEASLNFTIFPYHKTAGHNSYFAGRS